MKKLLLVAFCCGAVVITCWIWIRNSPPIIHPRGNSAGGTSQGGATQKVTADRVTLKRSPKPREPAEPPVKLVIPSNKGYAIEAEKRIAASVAKGDSNAWFQMFNQLFDLSVPWNEAVRIAKEYLNHPEPIIRFEAASRLYMLGDRSGAQTLIQLTLAPERIAVPGVESDLRALAASTLASYRETSAADAVATLYFANPEDLDLLSYAANLGAKQVVPEILAAMKEQVWGSQLEQLANLEVPEGKPVAFQRFNDENARIEMRTSAAGAMIRFGEHEPYVSYLVDVAGRYAAGEHITVAGQSAFRGLSLVHSDEVRELLEGALDSKNSMVSDHAMVALSLDYPESDKGRERLLQSFTGKGGPADIVYRLAAMGSDSQIRAAAAQRDAMLWQMAAVHEKNWDKQIWLRNLWVR